MTRRGCLAGLALVVLAVRCAVAASPEFGLLDGAELALPDGPAATTVFMFSPLTGIDEEQLHVVEQLRRLGAAVVSVELPHYLATVDAAGGDCAYLVADIERVSHQVGRQTGSTVLHPPVIAGRGAGGALVLDILTQTPHATLGAAVSVDPTVGVALSRPLCTNARRERSVEGSRYVLPSGAPPAPLTVFQSVAAGRASAARVDALERAGTVFALRRTREPAAWALSEGVGAALAALGAKPQALPLVELPATPTRDTLAVVMSGDGGWRDLDRSVAGVLQAAGVPTVGLDSLRYFWSHRTPEETARDIAQIIETYSVRWKVGHVLLVGYSFGADVLPAVYAALPVETRARISQIALLGLAEQAQWEVSVAGWLGGAGSDAVPTAPYLAALPAGLVQCFYGEEEDDTACPGLAARGSEVIETSGGHHFDDDYVALAQRILAGLDRRLGPPTESGATPRP